MISDRTRAGHDVARSFSRWTTAVAIGAALAFTSISFAGDVTASAGRRPNVVLIVTDDK
jgi:hypothetical protein